MTHTELSRVRALRSIERFLSALEQYGRERKEEDPRNRHSFVKGDGVHRIHDKPDLPPELLVDLAGLREALADENANDVATLLNRIAEADHLVPYDVDVNYRARYAELFDRGRDYVEISALAPSRTEAATHGPDFRDVTWYETKYVFSAKQAACVRILWEAWEQGTPWIADGTLLQKANVGDRQRLRDVFRDHAAWGKMIVQGPQQDLHGLPEKPIES